MKFKIFHKILAIVLFVTIASVLIVGMTSLNLSDTMANSLVTKTLRMKLHGDIQSARDVLKNTFGDLAYANGKLVDKDGKSIAGRHGFVDSISDKLDIVTTVFTKEGNDFKRISTNIKKDDGRRVVDTFLGEKSAAYASIMAKQLFVGQANILGKPYLTAYDPIINSQGDLIGILFIGIARHDIDVLIQGFKADLTNHLGLLALGVLLGGAAIAFLFAKRLSSAVGFMTSYLTVFARGESIIADKDQSTFQTLKKRKDEVGEAMEAFSGLMMYLSSKAQIADLMAQGDFSNTVKVASDTDTLGLSLQKMTVNLNDILSQIQGSGEQINAASGQVADSSQTLSQGATETAAALEEISSSMSEMASQTKMSAENASQASQLANDASRAAEKGGQQMGDMVAAMAEINDAGQNISKIIKVIDEIAFQTNLLALNAAVEAARAGQHGKGFAVVAEEVRNLAARSAKAASETSELIVGSVEKTKNGTQIAEQTSTALQEIVGAITKVTDLVAEIAAASSEQAQGITQVNQGLGQVDQAVQGNTATAEESAAAAEELSSQAEQLKHMLNRFKLEQSRIIKPATPQMSASAGAAQTIGWNSMPSVDSKPDINLDDSDFGKF